MASSGNFATWNATAPNKSDIAFSSGNCGVTSGSGAYRALSTFVIPTNSGKWYVEVCMTSNSGNTSYVGIVSEKSPDLNADGTSFNFGRSSGDKTVYFDITVGNIITENSNSQTGLSTFSSNDDIIAMVLDMDNDTVQFYGNNSALGSAQAFPDTGDNYYIWCGGNNDKVCHINAGQDSTFGGAISAGGNADANGFGDFKYSVPTDAKAITTANLPISDNIDPAQTDDDFPQKNFNVVTYTGNGSTQSITGLGFKPDLVWLKRRDGTKANALFDSTRGVTKYLSSDSNSAETTDTSTLTAFGTDGFSLASPAANNLVNGNGFTYVGWCWKANGGTTSSNTQGDVTSTVQANQAAGFSIVKFTGTLGESASTASVGHGLTAIPDLILSKSYDTGSKDWTVLHSGLTSRNYKLTLNTTAAEEDRSSAGDMSSLFTTTTYGTNATTGLNQSGRNYVAYVWHNVDGYSKFGKYIGNGNADGPFIYTGFRPRLVFAKHTTAARHWTVTDTARNTMNPTQTVIDWDASYAEYTSANRAFDIYSNGFKIRTSDGEINQSGSTFVFGAWGDVPFKYNNTF
tara:strand:- start:4 stop:1719 length:1716 start_codon:yes stop_codon:yes gene_type:complete